MKKILITMLVLIAWTASVFAQITREQADAIVLEYLKSELTQHSCLYVNVNTPNEEGIVITTYREEIVKVKYACWIYCAYEAYPSPAMDLVFTQYRYLFVKEDTGNLLEVITNNDFNISGNLNSWEIVKAPVGFTNPKENNKSLYPNPVNDWLTLPCDEENTRVEIYDLKGSRLFSGTLSDKDACRLDVSFLKTGTYVVNVSGKTYRIIKK